MGAALNDQQLAAIEQQMSTDPSIIEGLNAYQKWASNKGRMAYVMKGGPPNPQQVLAAHGINFPDIEDYQIQKDPQGQVKLKRENWFQRNADWIMPVATIGGGAAIGALAGAGGPAADATATSMLPGAEGGLAAGGEAAGGAAAAGGVGAAEGAAEGILPSTAIGSSTPFTAPAVTSSLTGAGTGGGILGGIKTGLNVLGKTEPILGNMAKAGADANAKRDALLPSMENAKLARDKFALEAPTTRMNQSMRASLIKSASPTKVNWGGPGSGLRGEIPSFTGGFSGALSNIDPRSRELADSVLSQDLKDQLAGKDKNLDYLTQFGHESPMDKIVGGASTAASIWDALKKPSTFKIPWEF